MKRNIWIPKMTTSKLERLLTKSTLTANDKEDLLDFKYFMIYEADSALEKGLLVELQVSQIGRATAPKRLFWLTNIDDKTKGFESKHYIN